MSCLQEKTQKMKLELLTLAILSLGCNQYRNIWNETQRCANKYAPINIPIPFDSINFHTIPDSLMSRNCGANGPGCFRKSIRTIYIKENEPQNTLEHEILRANGYEHGVAPFGVCDK